MINGVTEIEKYHGNFNSYSCTIMVIIKVIKFKLLKSKEQLLGKLENHGNARLLKKKRLRRNYRRGLSLHIRIYCKWIYLSIRLENIKVEK